jgi:DNA repair protein RadC
MGPVEGQLYLEPQADGQVRVLEYRRGEPNGKPVDQLGRSASAGRFAREVKENIKVTSPTTAGQYLLEHVYTPFEQLKDQEEMWVLLLNSRYKLTHQVMVYRGTVNTILVRIAELFREAVRLNAPALIIAHNHPSGDPEPSLDDRENACRVQKAAKLLDIELLDVMIVGKNSWVSLKQQLVI